MFRYVYMCVQHNIPTYHYVSVYLIIIMTCFKIENGCMKKSFLNVVETRKY